MADFVTCDLPLASDSTYRQSPISFKAVKNVQYLKAIQINPRQNDELDCATESRGKKTDGWDRCVVLTSTSSGESLRLQPRR